MTIYSEKITSVRPAHVKEGGKVRLVVFAGADGFDMEFSADHAERVGKSLVKAAKETRRPKKKPMLKIGGRASGRTAITSTRTKS